MRKEKTVPTQEDVSNDGPKANYMFTIIMKVTIWPLNR